MHEMREPAKDSEPHIDRLRKSSVVGRRIKYLTEHLLRQNES